MIIYNETYVIEEAIRHEWLNWMQTVQIPAIMKLGWFNTYKILTVLESPNEGVTYCVQFITDTREKYDFFQQQHLTGFTICIIKSLKIVLCCLIP
jgi:hypothetical protein